MNILFFLTPKSEVAFVYDDNTIRQIIEKMEHNRYRAIPILKRDGSYYGTITEGDILWYIKNEHDLNLTLAEDIEISQIPRRKDYMPVSVTAQMDTLVAMAQMQNFVPVIDGKDSFIGIIKRRDIIEFYYNEYKKANANTQG